MTITTTTNNVRVYHVNKAVRARLLILVDLIDDQEDHTHQEGQGTDHQQGHLEEGHLCERHDSLLVLYMSIAQQH